MLLPEVAVIKPHPGILVYEARGTGTVVPEETLKIYPESVKKVKEIKVKVGEKVKKGQIIAVLAGSTSDTLVEEEIKLIAVINEPDYLGGKEFEYRIIKRSRFFNTIIPNTALGQDNKGYFIYKIKERDGALGKEYYVEKEYITTGDSDSQNTVVLKGLDNRNSIIYSSDEIINDGSRVWLQ